MAVKIVVLSDGTWESVGEASILTITDSAYECLVDGNIETCDLKESDILENKSVDTESDSR